MEHELSDVLNRSFDRCENVEKLREVVKDLQDCNRALKTRIDNHSRKDISDQKILEDRERDITAREKTLNLRVNRSGSICPSTWILASSDYPVERTLVLYHDGRDFEIRNAGQFEGKFITNPKDNSESYIGQHMIVGTIPSRWRNTVYVHTQSCGSKSAGSKPPCVTSSKRPPEGLRWSRTLHLGKLPIGTKFRLMSGNIKWLFVTQNVSPRPSKVASLCHL
jgi:hypothetical protein